MVPACSKLKAAVGTDKVGGPQSQAEFIQSRSVPRFQMSAARLAVHLVSKRHAAPESTVQDFLHGVFFNVINQDSTRIDGRLVCCLRDDRVPLFVFECGVCTRTRAGAWPRSRCSWDGCF